jgi:hypothetical protein
LRIIGWQNVMVAMTIRTHSGFTARTRCRVGVHTLLEKSSLFLMAMRATHFALLSRNGWSIRGSIV